MNREVKSQQQLNFSTLSRHDPAIVDVLGNSGHVAVYRFDDVSKSWHRKDAEGSLFIVKRSEQPYYRIVVLNRLSTDNLVEDIKANLLIQLNGPYLIYRNSVGETNGIWFYEQADRDKIAQQIEDVKVELQQMQRQSNPEPQPDTRSPLGLHPTAFSSYSQPVTPQQGAPLHYFPPQEQQPPISHHHSQPVHYPAYPPQEQHLPPPLNHHTQPVPYPPNHTAPASIPSPTMTPSSFLPTTPQKTFVFDENSPVPRLLSPSNILKIVW